MIRRGLRLELVTAISIALAVSALANSPQAGLAQDAQGRELARQSTQTSLTTETHDQAGRTQVMLAITVIGEDSLPATTAAAKLAN